MASLESLNGKLKIAADALDGAVEEIHDLHLEPAKKHIRGICEALANIIEIQREIYRQYPELEPGNLREEMPIPDDDLTPEHKELIAQLTDEEIKNIDDALYTNTCDKWRKVARVVGATMMELPCRVKGIPDVYYSQRVQKLVKNGLLESQGNLSYMRFSEVRRPNSNET